MQFICQFCATCSCVHFFPVRLQSFWIFFCFLKFSANPQKHGESCVKVVFGWCCRSHFLLGVAPVSPPPFGWCCASSKFHLLQICFITRLPPEFRHHITCLPPPTRIFANIRFHLFLLELFLPAPLPSSSVTPLPTSTISSFRSFTSTFFP